MPLQSDPSNGFSDAVLAGSLMAAPAWAASLSELNQVLTTVSLIVGLLIGTVRLWRIWRDRR